MRIACIGDIHNDLENLKFLYSMLEHESLDAIYHLGDFLDRGPEPDGTLSFLIDKKIKGLLGNHESALLTKHVYDRKPPKNKDKLRSYNAILNVSGGLEYLASLPKFIVFEKFESILVHAGIDPLKSLSEQNSMCCYVSMVNPAHFGSSRWEGEDRHGNSEEYNRLLGWRPWYELYSYDYHVYHGHTVVRDPVAKNFSNSRYKRVMLDTGSWFTGMLSAAIIEDSTGPKKFISTPRVRLGQYRE